MSTSQFEQKKAEAIKAMGQLEEIADGLNELVDEEVLQLSVCPFTGHLSIKVNELFVDFLKEQIEAAADVSPRELGGSYVEEPAEEKPYHQSTGAWGDAGREPKQDAEERA
jgi:hypothetical protein